MVSVSYKVKSPVKNVPPRNQGRISAYDEAYREIALRLEQTPSEWLVFEFQDKDAASKARQTLQALVLDRLGKRVWRFQVRGSCLYVKRGDNYMKKIDM